MSELDWSKHRVLDLDEDPRKRRCRICRRPALMTDHGGRACHKVCAEVADEPQCRATKTEGEPQCGRGKKR